MALEKISDLLNKVIARGKTPKNWKTEIIIPLKKKTARILKITEAYVKRIFV